MTSKVQLLRVHKWCGLLAFALISIQAVTGIFEAYRHDIAKLADPSGMMRQSSGDDVPLNDVMQALRTAHPDQRVERIVFPETPTGTYFAHLVNAAGRKVYVSIDPGSAELLRSGDIWVFPAEAAARIHYDYTIGRPGMAIVALTGLLGLVMAVTGVSYWWPRSGSLLQQLRINRKLPGRFVLRQLHRSIGAVMALFLGFSLITGLVLAIYYFVIAAGTTTQTSTEIPRADSRDIDLAILRASSRYPAHDIRDVRFVGTDRVDIFFNAPERSARAAHQVSVNPRNGAITGTLDAHDNTALWVTWLPVHSGESFGILGKVLVTTNALVLFGLALSGPAMWLSMRTRRRASSR